MGSNPMELAVCLIKLSLYLPPILAFLLSFISFFVFFAIERRTPPQGGIHSHDSLSYLFESSYRGLEERALGGRILSFVLARGKTRDRVKAGSVIYTD